MAMSLPQLSLTARQVLGMQPNAAEHRHDRGMCAIWAEACPLASARLTVIYEWSMIGLPQGGTIQVNSGTWRQLPCTPTGFARAGARC